MPDPGPPPRSARACCSCQREFTADEMKGPGLWVPMRGGWRCPTCSRDHAKRIDKMARELIAAHPGRMWLGTNEHSEHYGCTICDVIARATTIVLTAPERARPTQRS